MVREFSQLDWIVEKASEVLEDKVKDGPLTDRDVEMAYDLFAAKRLKQLIRPSSGFDEVQAENYIKMKLQEKMKQLNRETWGRE